MTTRRRTFATRDWSIRRFKKDIRDQVRPNFRSGSPSCLTQAASPQEEAAYRALLAHSVHPEAVASGRQAAGIATGGHAEGAILQSRAALESTRKAGLSCCRQNTASVAMNRRKSRPRGFRGNALRAIDAAELQQVSAIGQTPEEPSVRTGHRATPMTALSSSPSVLKPCAG